MCTQHHFPFPTTPPLPSPRFSLLPPPRPDPFSLPFKPRIPKRPLSIRVGSSRPGASLNDVSTSALSFYELLGIPETGSLGEIKHAYKQLARKYHPDMSPPGMVSEYTRKFIRVQEAYETLSDPSLRAMYDQDMAKGLHFAFSARKAYNDHQWMDDRQEWKSRWQSQLSELKRRSMYKEASGSMSWGERVRRERNESSS